MGRRRLLIVGLLIAGIGVAGALWRPPNPNPLLAGTQHAPPSTILTVHSLRQAQPYFNFPLRLPTWPRRIAAGLARYGVTMQVVPTAPWNPDPSPYAVSFQITLNYPGTITINETAAAFETVTQVVHTFVQDGGNPNGPYRLTRVDGYAVWVGGNATQGLDLVSTAHHVVYEVHLAGPPTPADIHLGLSLMLRLLRT